MAEETQRIIIDIEANASAALAQLKELQATEAKLRDEQKALGEVTDENRDKYNAYSEAIKANKKEQQEQSKIIQNTIRDFKTAEGSMTALKAQLANLTKQYNDLSRAEREGDVGKALGEQISNITAELSRNEEALGNYRRNVGNYKSAVEGLLPLQKGIFGTLTNLSSALPTASAAFKGASAAAKAFGKQLLALCANPFIAIAAVIVTLVMKIVSAFKRNEAATMALKTAFAVLNPIIDIVRKAFDFLAEGIAAVIGWIGKFVASISPAAKAAQDLQKAQNDLVVNQRKLNEESAKSDQEVAELRAKVAEKDKYTNEERLAFLEEAIRKEQDIAEKKKAMAEEALRIAEEEAARSANDAEANERLSQAKIAVYNADKELSAKTRELNGQRAELVNSIKAEEEAAKKAATAERMKREAEAAKKAEEAYKNYTAATADLVARFKEVRDMVVATEEEQIAAIREKYDAAISAAADYTKEIEALSSKGSLTKAESERLAALEQMQFDSAQTQYRLEQQKQDEIKAIAENSAKERMDAAIAAIDSQHAVELARAKNNAEQTAAIEEAALREKAEAYKAAMNDEQLADTERLQAQVNYYATLAELEARDIARHKEAEEAKVAATEEAAAQMAEKRQQSIDIAMNYAQSALDALSTIFDLMAEREDAQLEEYKEGNDEKKDALQERLDEGLISQEDYDAQVAALDEDYERQKKELDLKQAKRQKAMAIMNATLNAAAAIIASLAQSPVAIGPIPNPAGIASLALATTMGVIQVAAAAATPLPKASRGVLLQGKSHAEGGIPIEAEGGEAIINKRSTARFRPLLSAINEWGGGVKFANGGIPLDGGYSMRAVEQYTNAVTKDDLQAVAAQPIYTTITDIRREDGRYSEIQSLKNV